MEKRYQIFVSSTFTDLKVARQHVMQTLAQMDCISAGMELFPAADEEQWEFIKKVIDDCDYYLLIVGGRYGSTTAEGLSFTEKEFDYAVEKQLRIVAFVHGDPDQIPVGQTDLDDSARKKLAAFREKVCTGRLVKYWTKVEELPGLVALSLGHAIKTYPMPGWVRGGGTSNPELLEQLNTLRLQNECLTAKLLEHEKQAGPAVARLAPLTASFAVRGTCTSNGNRHPWSAYLTWGQLFTSIGPHLFGAVNDGAAYGLVAHVLFARSGVAGDEPTLSDTAFPTIKVQLVALGLVAIGSFGNSADAYWSLTPTGRTLLMELATVRVPEA